MQFGAAVVNDLAKGELTGDHSQDGIVLIGE
jgi:hypothetical protein